MYFSIWSIFITIKFTVVLYHKISVQLANLIYWCWILLFRPMKPQDTIHTRIPSSNMSEHIIAVLCLGLWPLGIWILKTSNPLLLIFIHTSILRNTWNCYRRKTSSHFPALDTPFFCTQMSVLTLKKPAQNNPQADGTCILRGAALQHSKSLI